MPSRFGARAAAKRMNTALEIRVVPLSRARPTNRLLLFEGKFDLCDSGNFHWPGFTHDADDTQVTVFRVQELYLSLHCMHGSMRLDQRHLNEKDRIVDGHKTHATGRSALFLAAGAVVPSQN